MTTQKICNFVIVFLVGITIVACQKDPSTSSLHRDYLVYTAYNTSTDFKDFDTYYLPDSILLIGTTDSTTYWKDADAEQIITTVANYMTAAGYSRSTDKATSNLGLQLSYVEQVTYFVGYDSPYWWWYYPYYWAPTYWGDWTGWHYPYSVYYGYTAGSLLIEMVDLGADQSSNKKLPVVWDTFIGGLLTADADLNQERTLAAVEQAFSQSPYLVKVQ